MKVYTRTGDEGETSLIGGRRVRKTDPRIEAYGTVDELNAVIGLARAVGGDNSRDTELHDIQQDLFTIGAQLASIDASEELPGPSAERVSAIEKSIDQMDMRLSPLRNFILPGGSPFSAHLHVARTVCRRAERLVIALQSEGLASTVIYLNRLSDYLFVAARFANLRAKVDDVFWKPETD